MRPVGSHNDNANAAKMEKLLEDGINAIGLGPQRGITGKCASATGHIGVDFTLIGVGNDIPPYGRGSFSYVLPVRIPAYYSSG